jgi:hypothetical protein
MLRPLCAPDTEHPCDAFAERAAVWARRAIWPDLFLKPLASYVVILKDGRVEIGKHS